MSTTAIIVGATNIAKSVAVYLGLIENVSSDVKKLLHEPFKTATDLLCYAETSSGQNQIDYVKRARDKFVEATNLEANENLISAYVGLAMCQHLLGDKVNASITLNKISDVEISRSELTRVGASGAIAYPFPPILTTIPVPSGIISRAAMAISGRKVKFQEYKNKMLTVKLN